MILILIIPCECFSNVIAAHPTRNWNHYIDPCNDFYDHVCSKMGKEGFFDEKAGKLVKDAISPFYSKEIQSFIEDIESDRESTAEGILLENDKISLCELAGKNNEYDCEKYISNELPTNRIKMPGGLRTFLENIHNFNAFHRFVASNGTFLQRQKILQQYFLLLKDRVSKQFKKAAWTNNYPKFCEDMKKVLLIPYESSTVEYESVIANMSWMYHECKKLSPIPSREFLELCESYALSPALSIFLQLTEEDWELFFETGLFAHQGNYNQNEKKIRLYPLFYLLDQSNFPYLLGTTLFAMSHELSHVFFNDQGAIPPQKQCFEEQMIESCEIFVKAENCSERANRFVEDAADWVAMRTSLDFLEDHLKDGELHEQMRNFFYAHARSWCNENPNEGSQKHSPPKLRVNGLNRMFSEFQDAFQCSSESKMTKLTLRMTAVSEDSDFLIRKAAAKNAAKKTKPKDKGGDNNGKMIEEDLVFKSRENVPKKEQEVEDLYKRMSPVEHILLRPDTYIGSCDYAEQVMWTFNAEEKKMEQREVRFVPALLKIFDELIVNAADNKVRDAKMSVLKINIDRKTNLISVFNDGMGIPVTIHKKENVYLPHLVFGMLLTSSNYQDSERKITGGRNGYGAKLCNVMSTEFTVETSCKEYGKKYKQTWTNNMANHNDAQITESSGDDYTKISFRPDLKRFNMTELDDDIISIMSRRAVDIAGTCHGIKVFLNGRLVPVNGFKSYIDLYTQGFKGRTGEPVKVVYEKVNERWEVGMTVSENHFQQVSFVNAIATSKGGRHVDYVVEPIVQKMMDTIKKKIGKSTVNLKPFQVKNHVWIFVNALIENPTFDSQTKETMTLQSKNFGSKCELSEKFTKQALSCGIVDAVLSWTRFKQQEDMNKKCSGKKTTKLKGIAKLEDANDAGTKNSHLCTLILTEGDSAKSLAVSGLGVVGRDRYGVFPLRGKLLNVREGNIKQVAENVEINALIKILGLQYKKKYETEDDFKSLRYGKVMVMADQDQDGSHIKGLVINFFHYNWPSLIQKNFVEEFITPIVKATKGKEELSFFSIPEYNEWRNSTDNWKTYKTKYYKGLGTSTSKEAKEYFSDMARHRIRFKYSGKEDDAAVDMAFSKKKIEERKEWLTKWMAEKKERRAEGLEEEYLYDKDTRAVSFKDFINKELVLFSNTDNERSIPSLIDGFKPGQRKVVFSCFKRADKREVKVAQLAGAVGELSAYHHGEQSLMGTIVNLAQDFVGSNNVNLLLPIGQFGTRLQGGKDSASPRYIFTKLSPVARALFPVPDDNVLRFLFEDNQRIEPEWYCPIIPMVLVNGATGIGTAWSTNIPNFNPREIVENMRRLIRGKQPLPIAPWYRGFRGSIVQLDPSRFVCSGEVSEIGDDLIEITELPVKTWTQGYKESVLEPMLDGTDAKGDKEKKPTLIADFKEYHTDTTVRFVVKLPPGKLRAMRNEGLHKIFKLQTVLNTTSRVLFDAAGCLRKFNSPEEICLEFFDTRKQKYIDRKAFLEAMLRAQSTRLTNQARFILAKIKGEIVMENKKKAAIVEQLIKQKFDPDPVKKWKEEQKKKELEEAGEVEIEDEESEDEEEQQGDTKVESKLSDYDYLVGMALIKLSEEEKNKLLKESDDKLAELKTLEKKSWADLWNDDLENFLTELTKWEEHEKEQQESAIKTQSKKFVKEEGKGRGKKTAAFAAEVFPAKDGMRIEPTMEAMKEKYKEKKPREKKEPKEPKEHKKPKKEGGDTKQFLSPAKKDDWNTDESEEDDDFDESRAFESDEDAMDDVKEVIPQKKPSASRAPTENDSMDVDEILLDEHSNPPLPKKAAPTKKPPAPPKKAPEPKTNGKSTADFSDDDDVPKKKPAPSSKKIMESSDEEDNDAFTHRKPAASKKNIDDVYNISSDDDKEEEKPPVKKAAPKKKDVIDLSDDDEVVKKKKKPAPAKKAAAPKAPKKETKEPAKKMTYFFNKKAGGKKKKDESDDEDDDVAIELDDSPPPERKASGRARAKKNYAVDEDEDDDSDFGAPKKKRAKKAIDSDSD